MARVLAKWERAPSVFELELERDDLEYRCGDCTLLVRDDHVDSRPYSFSSHPDEGSLRFLIRKIPNGSFSQWLASVEPGDLVGVGTPFGWFRPGTSDNEVWFATGTGISPFLSALRARRPPRPRHFAIGVRSLNDVVLGPWMESRAPVSWCFSRGTASRRVTEDAGEVEISPQTSFFLCGNAGMIRSVSDILQNRGVVRDQIHEELFFQ